MSDDVVHSPVMFFETMSSPDILLLRRQFLWPPGLSYRRTPFLRSARKRLLAQGTSITFGCSMTASAVIIQMAAHENHPKHTHLKLLKSCKQAGGGSCIRMPETLSGVCDNFLFPHCLNNCCNIKLLQLQKALNTTYLLPPIHPLSWN